MQILGARFASLYPSRDSDLGFLRVRDLKPFTLMKKLLCGEYSFTSFDE